MLEVPIFKVIGLVPLILLIYLAEDNVRRKRIGMDVCNGKGSFGHLCGLKYAFVIVLLQ